MQRKAQRRTPILALSSGLARVTRSHLAMIESGSKIASVDNLWRISSALCIRTSELAQMVEDEIASLELLE